jgi:hypothetical protein
VTRQAGSRSSCQTLGISKERLSGIGCIQSHGSSGSNRVLGQFLPHPEGLASQRPSVPAFNARWPRKEVGIRGAVAARRASGQAIVACQVLGRYSLPVQALFPFHPRLLPNPSIERTCPGKPGQASHVKR